MGERDKGSKSDISTNSLLRCLSVSDLFIYVISFPHTKHANVLVIYNNHLFNIFPYRHHFLSEHFIKRGTTKVLNPMVIPRRHLAPGDVMTEAEYLHQRDIRNKRKKEQNLLTPKKNKKRRLTTPEKAMYTSTDEEELGIEPLTESKSGLPMSQKDSTLLRTSSNTSSTFSRTTSQSSSATSRTSSFLNDIDVTQTSTPKRPLNLRRTNATFGSENSDATFGSDNSDATSGNVDINISEATNSRESETSESETKNDNRTVHDGDLGLGFLFDNLDPPANATDSEEDFETMSDTKLRSLIKDVTTLEESKKLLTKLKDALTKAKEKNKAAIRKHKKEAIESSKAIIIGYKEQLEAEKARNKTLAETVKFARTNLLKMLPPEHVEHIFLENPRKKIRQYSPLGRAMSIQQYALLGCRRYRIMRRTNNFQWPSSRSIQRWIEPLNVDPGILTDMMTILKDQALHMAKEDRNVNLVFDEMALHESCDYDDANECFTGLPDISPTLKLLSDRQQERKPLVKLANHVLSAMVAGLRWRFKLIVGYYLTDDSFDGELFSKEVIKIVQALYVSGYTVKNITMDMGPCNVATMKALGVNCSK